MYFKYSGCPGETHVLQKEGGKTYRDSGPAMSVVFQGLCWYLVPEGKLFHVAPTIKKEASCLVVPFDF